MQGPRSGRRCGSWAQRGHWTSRPDSSAGR